jgi:hypothetical protein
VPARYSAGFPRRFYYEPVVRGRYPDLIAILPEVGVFVIEVKDRRLAELGSVNADTVTITRRGMPRLSRIRAGRRADICCG